MRYTTVVSVAVTLFLLVLETLIGWADFDAFTTALLLNTFAVAGGIIALSRLAQVLARKYALRLDLQRRLRTILIGVLWGDILLFLWLLADNIGPYVKNGILQESADLMLLLPAVVAVALIRTAFHCGITVVAIKTGAYVAEKLHNDNSKQQE